MTALRTTLVSIGMFGYEFFSSFTAIIDVACLHGAMSPYFLDFGPFHFLLLVHLDLI